MNISKERLERALSRFIYDFTEIEGHSDFVAQGMCDFSNHEFNYKVLLNLKMMSYQNSFLDQSFNRIEKLPFMTELISIISVNIVHPIDLLTMHE